MKITRSYWLGLGSGLILSALLTQIFFSQQGQISSAGQQALTQPLVDKGAKQANSFLTAQGPPSASPTAGQAPVPTQPSLSAQPSPSQVPAPQSSSPIEQNFSIPKGVSSEQIADLLLAQNFIKDKTSFLTAAHQMGAENRFKAGTYSLTQGLTSEELINRLVKN